MPILDWWQGVWGHPEGPIAGPRRAGRRQEVLDLMQWGAGEQGLLAVSRILGILGCLGRVLVQLN
jgi:hypothetical protein